MKIAYLGIPGSNSYVAAKRYFRDEVELIGVHTFNELFTDVISGVTESAVVPIENSLSGTIGENYDLLNKYDVSVVGEVYLEIENNLLAPPSNVPNRLHEIKKVLSHPQPFVQCSQFFDTHPKMEKIFFSDTAAAAKYVSEQNDATQAAIGNTEAARLYNLEVLEKNINDHKHNLTRFFVIKSDTPTDREANKCSVIFTLPHTPGSLVKALQVLSDNKVNLEKIESRPIQGKPFEYNFYCDFTYSKDQHIEILLKEFNAKTHTLKVLGCFKKGKH